jgi:hypothetical protein
MKLFFFNSQFSNWCFALLFALTQKVTNLPAAGRKVKALNACLIASKLCSTASDQSRSGRNFLDSPKGSPPSLSH